MAGRSIREVLSG
jgi:putative transposase